MRQSGHLIGAIKSYKLAIVYPAGHIRFGVRVVVGGLNIDCLLSKNLFLSQAFCSH